MKTALWILAALSLVAVAVRIVLAELWLRRMVRQMGLERTDYPLREKLFTRFRAGRTQEQTPNQERKERSE